jgi:hypothetical protein
MWGVRSKFVHAFFKDCFCPFTRTTGRSESFNSNFKEYVLRKDTIENFLKQYELFQENIVEVENQDRFESTVKNLVFWSNQPIERHAASIYTRGIYLKFVTELMNASAFGITEVVKDKIYEVKKLFHYDDPEYWRSVFTVCTDRDKMTFECECGKYQKDGIVCCHILRIFNQWDVVRIPDDYILPRWTSAFREKELLKHKQEMVEVHGSEKSSNSIRYAMLMNCMNDVCEDMSRDARKSKNFIEEVQKLHARLMTENGEVNQDGPSTLNLKDPPVIKKSSSKKQKAKETEEVTVLETATVPEQTVDVWIHEDGTVSKSTQVP